MKKLQLSILALIVGASLCYTQDNNQELTTDAKNLQNSFEQLIENASRWENYTMILTSDVNSFKENSYQLIANLSYTIESQKTTIENKRESQQNLLTEIEKLKNDRDEAIKEKNSFIIFGATISKSFFISIVIFLFIVLLTLTGGALILLKRCNNVSCNYQKELHKLKEEFEEYRQETRKNKERIVIEHHREIQKLKGEN
ncbi:hypothetical protein QA597_03605 [Marinilabiliaceae bacterium ANBcel2]|nr:hypothetical protein [Marinilabiliaceae bacterium ANBcel2]